MPSSPFERCAHILEAVANIRTLMDGQGPRSLDDLVRTRPALERHLEIISEAVRHLPETIIADYPAIPWRDIGSLGNRLRHGYDRVRPDILWAVYVYELEALEFAILHIQNRLRDTPDQL
jgi:uncharacterized protein with HEPN domain